MPGILADFARARASAKRGSSGKVQLDSHLDLSDDVADDFMALDEAIERLKALDERKAAAVELHYSLKEFIRALPWTVRLRSAKPQHKPHSVWR